MLSIAGCVNRSKMKARSSQKMWAAKVRKVLALIKNKLSEVKLIL